MRMSLQADEKPPDRAERGLTGPATVSFLAAIEPPFRCDPARPPRRAAPWSRSHSPPAGRRIATP
ncbi:hypothetical protein ACYCCF_23925 [Streptomyces argenteolus]|uniref:hypothetical protein n=1 Tax=Streptomyces sp. NPDC025273 TaxID=3155251 RepID=UPI0033C9C540